jgi:pteridine reductase
MPNEKVVLITGAGKRVGAVIARLLHAQNMKIVVHYRSSAREAELLAAELNKIRPDSAAILAADLLNTAALTKLINQAADVWGRLDVLINNASSFYPTAVGEITEAHWDDLVGTNLKAPLFLTQAAAPFLKKQHGCVLNIVDINAQRPLPGYPVYCAAKAGLLMLTKAMARELGPEIRVNAIAPGVVLWPDEEDLNEVAQAKVINRTVLKRVGTPEDIAKTARFLVCDADYVTGEVIAVDGGRSLT